MWMSVDILQNCCFLSKIMFLPDLGQQCTDRLAELKHLICSFFKKIGIALPKPVIVLN